MQTVSRHSASHQQAKPDTICLQQQVRFESSVHPIKVLAFWTADWSKIGTPNQPQTHPRFFVFLWFPPFLCFCNIWPVYWSPLNFRARHRQNRRVRHNQVFRDVTQKFIPLCLWMSCLSTSFFQLVFGLLLWKARPPRLTWGTGLSALSCKTHKSMAPRAPAQSLV